VPRSLQLQQLRAGDLLGQRLAMLEREHRIGGAVNHERGHGDRGQLLGRADRVLPEYQQPQVGDMLGYGKNRMRFERVEPPRVLATRSEDGNWVWSFVLDERDGKTSLISATLAVARLERTRNGSVDTS
jgi:hypothetical protein